MRTGLIFGFIFTVRNKKILVLYGSGTCCVSLWFLVVIKYDWHDRTGRSIFHTLTHTGDTCIESFGWKARRKETVLKI
jgi:hypothetical protein